MPRGCTLSRPEETTGAQRDRQELGLCEVVSVLAEQAAAVPAPAHPASADDLQSIERAMVEQALQNARFDESKAAKALGLTRSRRSPGGG